MHKNPGSYSETSAPVLSEWCSYRWVKLFLLTSLYFSKVSQAHKSLKWSLGTTWNTQTQG